MAVLISNLEQNVTETGEPQQTMCHVQTDSIAFSRSLHRLAPVSDSNNFQSFKSQPSGRQDGQYNFLAPHLTLPAAVLLPQTSYPASNQPLGEKLFMLAEGRAIL